MHAALVCRLDRPPTYDEVPAPEPMGEHDELVDVLAAGLHPRVRSQANGSHYTSTGELPLIPGIDGVGRRRDGTLVYFVLPDGPHGSMADATVVDLRRSVPLPDGTDPLVVAAAMNPGMSSWVALRRRVALEPGQSVLILGATGSAGQLAIQVAKHLGAASVVAAGRDATRLAALPALGADRTIDLAATPDEIAHALATHAADVDVVLDYLWGPPAQAALLPLLHARTDRAHPLTWISIGAIAGPDLLLPSAALRQANLRLLGSGQGSVSAPAILETLPSLVTELVRGTFHLEVAARPLHDVEQIWIAPTQATERVVLVPSHAVARAS